MIKTNDKKFRPSAGHFQVRDKNVQELTFLCSINMFVTVKSSLQIS